MNTPPSDVNESTIDIFVLGGSPAGSSQIRDHLEQNGYRVTLFTESAQLIEALRSGKPNLLIGDATSGEPDAFQVCKQIKTDENLWMIPVLVVTPVSDLGDLLHILDSSADEFIASPYNFRYLLSLVEGMLMTPVERLTPDQITTQFKIQHDDQLFVVTADRRKLLEFLLSSFELAVDRSGELAQVTADLSAVSANLKKSKETIVDHSRTIDALNSALQKKEEREKALTSQLSDRETRITGQDTEIARLSRELDETRNLLSDAHENIRTMTGEREETARAHQSGTDGLLRKISDVSAELELLRSQHETTTSELAAVKSALDRETAQHAAATEKAEQLARQNDGLEERLITLDTERGRALSALDEEKNRALVAEEEARSVRKTSAETAEALNQKLTGLEEELGRRSADLTRLTALLETETGRFAEATARIRALEQEREESEAILRSNAIAAKQQLTDLQAEYDSVIAALDAEEQRTKTLENNLAAGAQKADADLRSVSDHLAQAQIALESDRTRIKSLEEELGASRKESEASVTALSRALEDARSALERDKELNRASAENLNARIHELETVAQTLETNRNVIRLDLEAAVAFRTDLEARLALAENKCIDLESNRAAVAGELEQVRAELDSVRRQHRDAENREISSSVAREQYESTLRSEKDERALMESRLNEQIAALKDEYSIVLAQRKALEHQVADLSQEFGREKIAADQRLEALTSELQQARTALADEWEDHMNTDERLTAAVEEKQQLRQSLFQVVPVTAMTKMDPGALVEVNPDAHSHAPVELPGLHKIGDRNLAENEVQISPRTESQSVPFNSGIDDLFEPVPERSPNIADPQIPKSVSSLESQPDVSVNDAIVTDDAINPVIRAGSADTIPHGPISFNRQQWFDLLRWAHRADSITQDQRMQIVRMGRLIQRGRKLTKKQEEQVREMLVLAHTLGFRMP